MAQDAVSDSFTPDFPGVGSSGKTSGKSKPTQNDALSFELTDWLNTTSRLAEAATEGPWEDRRDGLTDWVSVVHDQEFVTFVAETGKGTEKWAVADAEFIAHARTALPQAVAVLRAVTDLHRPRNRVTRSASGHLVDTPGPCTACDWDWPCPTITAITETLGEV